MTTPTIVATAICVDQPGDSAGDLYVWAPRDAAVRRRLYWLSAYLLCRTSLRWNPDSQHVIFTNDTDSVIECGIDIRSSLVDLGVEIVTLPFACFDPGARSRFYRNAYYKLDAVQALRGLGSPAILLDSDCLWVMPSPELHEQLGRPGQLLVQDTEQLGDDPHRPNAQGLTLSDLAEVYARLDHDAPVGLPTIWGGEVVGGTPEALAVVASIASRAFGQLVDQPELARFHNGLTLFDSDELLSSFAYHRSGLTTVDSMLRYTVRLETARRLHRRRLPRGVERIAIWHVPNEKQRGLPLLFEAVADGALDRVDDEDVARWVGRFVGIPRRRVHRRIDLVDAASCGRATAIGGARMVRTFVCDLAARSAGRR